MRVCTLIFVFGAFHAFSQYPPAANMAGTEAIHKDSSIIVNWASFVSAFQRGPQDIAVSSPLASHGDSTQALGVAEGNSVDVVSLGDKGEIVLGFDFPIQNGPGPDFAVFENSFSHDYLEFAHVEVSSDGINFVRFPSHSLIQTTTQTGPFENSITEEVDNLAGKYIQGYGTPFDLEDVIDSTQLNLDSILFVKIIDVVGSINPTYGTEDAQGNLINDPYPTAFESGGFDLDGIAVINENNIFASIKPQENQIVVFPNPTTDVVYLSFQGPKIVELYDLSGRLIFVTDGIDQISISAKELVLSRGTYVLKIGQEAHKLIVE